MKDNRSKAHQQKVRVELYQKLDAAEAQSRICKAQASHKDVMARLKKICDAPKAPDPIMPSKKVDPDILEAKKRQDEPTYSFEEVKRSLRKKGKL